MDGETQARRGTYTASECCCFEDSTGVRFDCGVAAMDADYWH